MSLHIAVQGLLYCALAAAAPSQELVRRESKNSAAIYVGPPSFIFFLSHNHVCES